MSPSLLLPVPVTRLLLIELAFLWWAFSRYYSMFGLGLSVFPGVLSIALSLLLYWFRRVSAWKP